jgi:hypothetical protein
VAHQVALDGLGHEVRHLDLAAHEKLPGIVAVGPRRRIDLLAQAAQVDGTFPQRLGGDPRRADGDPARAA